MKQKTIKKARSLCYLLIFGLCFVSMGCDRTLLHILLNLLVPGSPQVGAKVCLSCHNGLSASNERAYLDSVHGMLGVECEECHGPGRDHVSQGGLRRLIDNPSRMDFVDRNTLCGECHPADLTGLMTSGHWTAEVAGCTDCHAAHGSEFEDELRAPSSTNELCQECHALTDFPDEASVAAHTRHTVDPDGTGASRCTACHMPPVGEIPAVWGVFEHTFAPVSPLLSIDMIDAGEPVIGTNSCMAAAGCHDGTVPGTIVWDHENRDDNVAALSIYNIWFEGGTELSAELCLSCHNGSVAEDKTSWRDSIHGLGSAAETFGCTGCHGPGLDHVLAGGGDTGIDDPGDLPPEEGNQLCGQCHPVQASGMASGAHVPNGASPRCFDCHLPHGSPNTFDLNLSADDNSLCLNCHTADGFGDDQEISAHTNHSVDPEGTGASRCIACHMPPVQGLASGWEQYAHTFNGIPPQVSIDMIDDGQTEILPNTCMAAPGCHDESSAAAIVWDHTNRIDDVVAQSLFDIWFGTL
jgi:predicted CXXCH cytochrome family protein